MSESLSDDCRLVVFAALVYAQDGGHSVPESRRLVGSRFGLGAGEVEAIEAEGLERDWPPVGE